jgi:hypothetical protein
LEARGTPKLENAMNNKREKIMRIMNVEEEVAR